MEKEYFIIHIVEVSEHNGEIPPHDGWWYELRPEAMNKKPLDKAYRRRSDATRFANKIAWKVQQWYAA
jgi:hypothetical protein